jgi:IS1 family transposase
LDVNRQNGLFVKLKILLDYWVKVKYSKNMNKLPEEKRAQILQMLCEGSSMRSISRIADVSINTVTKLLVDAGVACAAYHDATVRGIQSKRIQCDEIWSFCYAKEKNVPDDKKGKMGFGDVYTWTAIDADTKLIVSWFIGRRDAESAKPFMQDVAARLKNRVQLTTDGHKAYLIAVEEAFGSDVDFSQLVKLYGSGIADSETRYSPAKYAGSIKQTINGDPNPQHISTSYVERQNLTMRMNMRRFTRLTNAFSKKLENHCHALALYFMYYNFCRIHQTLRVTPAMEAKVTDHVWTFEEILRLLRVS